LTVDGLGPRPPPPPPREVATNANVHVDAPPGMAGLSQPSLRGELGRLTSRVDELASQVGAPRGSAVAAAAASRAGSSSGRRRVSPATGGREGWASSCAISRHNEIEPRRRGIAISFGLRRKRRCRRPASAAAHTRPPGRVAARPRPRAGFGVWGVAFAARPDAETSQLGACGTATDGAARRAAEAEEAAKQLAAKARLCTI
jgi:hypothetical protein